MARHLHLPKGWEKPTVKPKEMQMVKPKEMQMVKVKPKETHLVK
jgi:hypothetical protein